MSLHDIIEIAAKIKPTESKLLICHQNLIKPTTLCYGCLENQVSVEILNIPTIEY